MICLDKTKEKAVDILAHFVIDYNGISQMMKKFGIYRSKSKVFLSNLDKFGKLKTLFFSSENAKERESKC